VLKDRSPRTDAPARSNAYSAADVSGRSVTLLSDQSRMTVTMQSRFWPFRPKSELKAHTPKLQVPEYVVCLNTVYGDS
jgi:hypothetical protein